MNSGFRFFTAVLLGSILVCRAQLASEVGPSAPLPEPQTVAGLVQQLRDEWRGAVEQDQGGRTVKLWLGQKWCTDRNIALVAQIKDLRELRLQSGHPTVEGLRLMRQNSRLCSLHFAGYPQIPAGMLREAASFPHITELHLYGADSSASEYASLASMTNLTDLSITAGLSFGDSDLSRLTNLPNLKSLCISSGALRPASAALLPRFRALTNFYLGAGPIKLPGVRTGLPQFDGDHNWRLPVVTAWVL